LTITAVNPNVSEPRLAEIHLRGATLKEASLSFVTNADVHAHNTFEARDVVAVQTKGLNASGETVLVEFAPASVNAVSVELG
jgi:alpha-L-arabinofuranosidase